MKKQLLQITIVAMCCSALNAQTPSVVPIMLYPDSDHGTCSIGLRVNAGGAILRSGPGTEFAIVATLKAGHVVSGCNEENGWDGVIDGLDQSCSVGVILSKKQPYDGACASGWIEQKSLTSIYG